MANETQTQRERHADYMRKWRRAHPERERAAQIRRAMNLLKRSGYTVKHTDTTKGGEVNG